jgi:hypothetical protein
MPATTTLLGLVTPTQGTLSGTWGDTVNYGISDYVDIAVAGTLTLTNDGAVTLANTTGSSSGSSITSSLTGAGTVTAQFAIVKVTGTLTVAKVVTGPSYSKTYTVVNSATGGIVTFKASGQTGVSIAVGETAFVYFNGTDYVKIVGTATAGAAGGSTTQVQFNSSGVLAGSANMTFNGTTLTVNDLTDSSLTATRIVFAGTAGNLNDSANLTWNGTSLSATQIDITAQGPLRLQDTTGGEYVGLRSPGTLGASYTLTFPADDGTSGQALITDGSGVLSWSTAASGDVYGPGSSTDNAVARFDLTTGKLIQNSVGILSDAGILTGLTGITSSGSITFSSLTSGRVTFAGASGLLTDSANLTWDGTTLSVVGRLYNGDASTFGASTWGMSLGNGGASANYFKASTTYWQNNAGTQILQLSAGALALTGSANAIYSGVGTTGWSGFAVDTTGGNALFGLDDSTGSTFGSEAYATVIKSTSKPIYFKNGNTTIGYWNATGLGIGTTSVTQRLHVATTSGNAYIRVDRASQATGQVGLQIGGGTSSVDWIAYMPTSSDDLVFFGNSSNRVRMTSAGDVVIGADSAASKLDVVRQGNSSGGTIMMSGSKTNNANKYGNLTGAHYGSTTYPQGICAIGVLATSTDNFVDIGGNVGEQLASNTIRFWTAANSTTAGGTERGRFTSGGVFKLGIANDSAGTSNLLIVGSGNTQNANVAVFNTANANVNGIIVSNWDGTTTTNGPRIAFDNSGRGSWAIGSGNGVNSFDICQTWGTPSVRIDGSNNLLVGSTVAAGRLYSYTSSNQWALYGESGLSTGLTSGIMALVSAQNSVNNSYKAIVYYNAGAGVDRFSVADSGSIATAGSIALGTNGNPPTSGIGVQFPATVSLSSNANTLDDYEEGSWTPDLRFGGAKVGITYIYQSGNYVKIGRQVTVWATIYLSSKGSSTGDASFYGLPYAPSNTFYNEQHGVCGEINNMTFSGYLNSRAGGSEQVQVFQNISGSALTSLSNTNYQNDTSIAIALTYTTNA